MQKIRSNVKEISAKLHHISKKFREFLDKIFWTVLNCGNTGHEIWYGITSCYLLQAFLLFLFNFTTKQTQKHSTTWQTFVSNCLVKNRQYSTSTLDDFGWRAWIWFKNLYNMRKWKCIVLFVYCASFEYTVCRLHVLLIHRYCFRNFPIMIILW
jgi:hypothetical protein